MIAESLLARRRGEHNIERRIVRARRRKGWRTSYTERKQAMDRKAREIMRQAVENARKKNKTAIEAQRRPGLVGKIKAFFKPRRTMQAA